MNKDHDNPNSLGTAPKISPFQRRILLVGALLTVIALLFPPWSYSGGASSGYNFLFLPLIKRVSIHVNSSLLFLELAGIALITWLSFVAARHAAPPRLGRLAKFTAISLLVISAGLFGWFVWPQSYSEANGVRTNRFTGIRYVWLDTKGWITEAEKEAETRAEEERSRAISQPVLDELKLVHFGRGDAIDHLSVYNPTHWLLPYGDTKLSAELYYRKNGRSILLKIVELGIKLEPGINDVYISNISDLSGTTPLIQKIKIIASSARLVGGDSVEVTFKPLFVIEHERSCNEEVDLSTSDSKTVCR
jgi:hypothetical protein